MHADTLFFASTTLSSPAGIPFLPPSLFPNQLQRERDRASVKEARRIWVQGLESDRAAAAAIAATNATAAAAAAADAADSTAATAAAAAEESATAEASGGGMLSFLDPPTSEAEAFAAAAITERYRVLGEEADARAARARWKRQRSARVVAARAALKVLYDEEAHLWKEGTAAAAAAAAEAGEGVAGTGIGTSEAVGGLMGDGPARTPEGIEAVSVASVNSGSDSGGERTGSLAGEAQAGGIGQGASDGDSCEVEVEVDMDVEGEEEGGTAVPGGTPVAPEVHVKHSEDAKFSPVNIVDEPGGKSVGVSAALDGAADEALEPKFSHVNIVQEPGGESRGVSQALGAGTDSCVGDGMTAAAAATAGALPGRAGLRRIVQEPGGDSHAVSHVMNHGSGSSSGDRTSGVGDGTADRRSSDPLPRGNVQGSGDAVPGILFPPIDGMVVSAAATAAEGGGIGSDDRPQHTSQPGPSTSGGSLAAEASSCVAAAAPPPPPPPPLPAARDQELSGRHRNSGRVLPESKEKENTPRRRQPTGARALLPLEVMVRRCVTEPVLAQCSAIDSAALAFLVRDAGVAEHLASLRTFLLGLTSDFLHDFTLRLLDGLYDGG